MPSMDSIPSISLLLTLPLNHRNRSSSSSSLPLPPVLSSPRCRFLIVTSFASLPSPEQPRRPDIQRRESLQGPSAENCHPLLECPDQNDGSGPPEQSRGGGAFKVGTGRHWYHSNILVRAGGVQEPRSHSVGVVSTIKNARIERPWCLNETGFPWPTKTTQVHGIDSLCGSRHAGRLDKEATSRKGSSPKE